MAIFQTAFAAVWPISVAFGKWLVPHIVTYEMTKINWASELLSRPVAYCDISEHLGTK